MSISVFGYILFAGVFLLAAYLVAVSTVEPPLEHYQPPAAEVNRPADKRG